MAHVPSNPAMVGVHQIRKRGMSMQASKVVTFLLAASLVSAARTTSTPGQPDQRRETPQTSNTSTANPTSPSKTDASQGSATPGSSTAGPASGATATPQSDRGTASPKAEERLYKEVRHELVMLPNLTLWDNLAYKVEGYKVTLLGQVRNASLKSEAENSVKRIEGVEQVDNQIQILPASPTDDRIRTAVARSIFDSPGLFPYAVQSVPPIHIIVQGGNVSLEGVVNNEGDKNMAEIRAKQVPGVFSVTNHLQVASQSAQK
jgi:hyperosmotically inducible periplasmic protein